MKSKDYYISETLLAVLVTLIALIAVVNIGMYFQRAIIENVVKKECLK